VDKCYKCKRSVLKSHDRVEIYRRGNATGQLIHRECIDGESYGICNYCGSFIAHPNRDLNQQSECEAHAGESNLDPDECQGLDDIIENVQKNG
jgi:hypothetical protein